MYMQQSRKKWVWRTWQTKYHSDLQNLNIFTAYFSARTDNIFKIIPKNLHVQKDYNISVHNNWYKRATAIFTEGHGQHVAAEQVDDVLVKVVREYRERGGHSVRQRFQQVML